MDKSTCHLCGLPLRYGAVVDTIGGQAQHFCCQGCRAVYTMLLEAADADDPSRFKESALYRRCVEAGVIPSSEEDLRRIRTKEAPSTHVEPTALPGMISETKPSGTLALNLMVEGMWCPACAWVIEGAVSKLSGVLTASCHFSTDRLRCRYRPDRIAPDQIRKMVTRMGYGIGEVGANHTGGKRQVKELIRLVVTALMSANVMMLSWALYAGFFTTLSNDAISKISFPIAVMATVVIIYGGGPMLRKGWFGFVHRSPGMETLVGMAAGCAYAYSLYNWLAGSIHLYFDTACMLITLVLLGKVLEQQAKNRVRQELDNFFALQPAKVRVVTDNLPKGRYVAIGHLKSGDRFAVEAGEIVAADGSVVTGTATLDESSLTGEPRPVVVKAGDPVKSGTRLIEGGVTVQATKVGDETILGQMIAIMIRSLEQKNAFEGRTDRILRWFVPTILVLAGGTGIFCHLSGLPANQSVVRAVTVMVISCPCALGVAIPMARLAGIWLAGQRGILVREIEAFDRVRAIDTIVFDKTGTLTHGRWRLIRVESLSGHDPRSILAWAAGLEQTSQHEIARAICAHAREQAVEPIPATDIVVTPGGIRGRINENTLSIGNRRFAWGDRGPDGEIQSGAQEMPTSRVYLSNNGNPSAVLIFGDTIRDSVPALVETLKSRGLALHLISGDGDAVTRQIAVSCGLTEARGGLLPADKADYIDVLSARGHHAAMVGDGINDAAAMTRAHLAAAIHSGSGLAKEAAHITLMRGGPAQLLDFFDLSRKVNRKVIQNLWCAWIYNLIGIPVAMSGLLTPLVAATAMLLSSLTVIGNTLLLLRKV